MKSTPYGHWGKLEQRKKSEALDIAYEEALVPASSATAEPTCGRRISWAAIMSNEACGLEGIPSGFGYGKA